jgi:hypothetical protein
VLTITTARSTSVHNLHFILVRADSAEEAAQIADSVVFGFGGEDNWYQIGGVASEDGSDDQNDHGKNTRFPLSRLDDDPSAPKEGSHFERAIQLLRDALLEPAEVQTSLHDLGEKLLKISGTEEWLGVWEIRQELSRLHAILYARQFLDDGDIPEFRPFQFDEFGLTRIDRANKPTEVGEAGKQRYIVFIDMHS